LSFIAVPSRAGGQPEPLDDLFRDRGRIAASGHHDGRFTRSRQFQVGELALEQLGREEVAVPFGQPVGQHLRIGVQQYQPGGGTPVEQELTVRPLECGTRHNR
jgi:hypothetical protein